MKSKIGEEITIYSYDYLLEFYNSVLFTLFIEIA